VPFKFNLRHYTAGVGLPNAAFVFIKPHANTEAVRALVKEKFAGKGIRIVAEGQIEAETIDKEQLIDQHYYAIASKATLVKPKDMPVPADKFEEKFGITWWGAVQVASSLCGTVCVERLCGTVCVERFVWFHTHAN
jgi:hypothetical protein